METERDRGVHVKSNQAKSRLKKPKSVNLNSVTIGLNPNQKIAE